MAGIQTVDACTALDIKALWDVLNELCDVRSKWKMIGLGLRLQPSDLDAMSGSVLDCLQSSLSKWLKEIDPPPTWAALVAVLRSPVVDEEKKAQELEEKFCSGTPILPDTPTPVKAKEEGTCEPTLTSRTVDVSEASDSSVTSPTHLEHETTPTMEDGKSTEGPLPSPAAEVDIDDDVFVDDSRVPSQARPSLQSYVERMTDSEVKKKVKRKDNQFRTLVRKTHRHLSRTIKKQEDFADFKVAITLLPASINGHHILLSPDDRTAIMGAKSFDQMFVVLNQYWTFHQYELLEYIVQEYGNARLKKEMKAYVDDMDELEAQVGIDHFTAVRLCYQRPDSVAMDIRLSGTQHMLHDARLVQRSVAERCRLHPHTVRTYQSTPGSTVLTLLIPYAVAGHVMATFRGMFPAGDILSRPLEERVVYTMDEAETEMHLPLMQNIDSAVPVPTGRTERRGSGDSSHASTGYDTLSKASEGEAGAIDESSSQIAMLTRICVEVEEFQHKLKDQISEEPFFLCVQRGDLCYLVELLDKDPEGINAREETGQTLLHCACALGQLEIVIYLLNHRDCSVSEQDEIYGHTPLHIACIYNQSRVVAELLRKLSSVEGSVCLPDKFGWTPLHHAARNGNVELCKLLVSNDCRPHLQNMLGKTACHYAAEGGHLDVLKYLYDYVEKRVTPPIISDESVPPTTPTLLHCAALNNQAAVVEWLQQRSYPPHTKCRRILDLDGRKTRDEYAEDVAACRGHMALRGTLSAYRMLFEGWIKDIKSDVVPLDRIKLCICGHAGVGKSAMRESLSKPYLQQIFGTGTNVTITPDSEAKRHTFGIDICMMHLSGKDIFSVWDFAGQVDNFITHDFFISTQSTVFTVLVKLTSPIEVQRLELLLWLGFIKTRNLGQKPLTNSPMEQDRVPMSTKHKPRRRLLTAKQMQCTNQRLKPVESADPSILEQNGVGTRANGEGVERVVREGDVSGGGGVKEERWREGEAAEGKREPENEERTTQATTRTSSSPVEMYGSYIQPVPVLIVGSHYDKLEGQRAVEAVQQTQRLVDELREQYEEYLDISPQLYPLNCLKSVSVEIRALKERLCVVRSKLVDVQPLYPRVMEKVARQIESLRAEQPQTKVLSWDKLHEIVKSQNQLLSDKQLSYICKCLTDAGVVVYFEEGALSNHIIIDPAWLCKDVLGQALAPGNFPHARASLSRVGSHEIARDVVQQKLSQFLDHQHIQIIIQLLQDFDLCHYNRDTGKLCFPAFLTENLDPELWKRDVAYEAYIGRRLVCSDITDSFPPGFFSRLQVQILNSLRAEKVFLFKGSFLVEGNGYQCLVDISVPVMTSSAASRQRNTAYSSAITIKARAATGHSFSCCQHLDLIQTMIAQLVRVACPTVFLDLLILSSSDLKAHSPDPYCYTIYNVISAESRGQEVTNDLTGFKDNPLDLLYLGDEAVRKTSSGRNTKVAYLSEDIVQRIEALLVDGEKDWRDLARKLGLDKYILLLEGRSPHSTRLLLLKWGEKPRWTVDSLLYALNGIGRVDVANFIRARMGL